jgi:hypothetical protein
MIYSLWNTEPEIVTSVGVIMWLIRLGVISKIHAFFSSHEIYRKPFPEKRSVAYLKRGPDIVWIAVTKENNSQKYEP